MLAWLALALAQNAAGTLPPRGEPVSGPDVVVTGQRRCAPGARDIACIDAELKASARAAVRPTTGPTAQDTGPPNRVGTFSYAATAQRLGSNFGRAAAPPPRPAPIYSSPILRPTPTP